MSRTWRTLDGATGAVASVRAVAARCGRPRRSAGGAQCAGQGARTSGGKVDRHKSRCSVAAFGRKSIHDFIIEAALAVPRGRPAVKVLWTREDDLQHDYYQRSRWSTRGGLDENGEVVAWLHRSALPPIDSMFQQNVCIRTKGSRDGRDRFSVRDSESARRSGAGTAHTRIGWLRSVINIPHGFAIASSSTSSRMPRHRDPKDFILDLLGP